MGDGDEKTGVIRSAEACPVPLPAVTVPWREVRQEAMGTLL